MKATLKLLVALFFISFASSSFAHCYDSCGRSECPDSICSKCECTDPSCGPKGYNDCLSKSRCCEAFGNVGAR